MYFPARFMCIYCIQRCLSSQLLWKRAWKSTLANREGRKDIFIHLGEGTLLGHGKSFGFSSSGPQWKLGIVSRYNTASSDVNVHDSVRLLRGRREGGAREDMFKRRRGGWRVCATVCLKDREGGQGVCLPSRFRDPVGEQWQELIRWQSPGLCVYVCILCVRKLWDFLLSFQLAGRWPRSRV